MDFVESLTKQINADVQPEPKLIMGYLQAKDSLVIYSIPGGRVIEEFYDGVKTQQLNYEIAMKTKSSKSASDTLWDLQTYIEDVEYIPSENNSFEFEDIVITNTPYINSFDEQAYFVFQLDIQATLTIYKEKGSIK